MKKLIIIILSVTGFLALSISAFAASQDPGPINRELFGMVGATAGQTARLNIVAYPPTPCIGTLSFFGSDGALLAGPTDVNLAPGHSTFLDFDATQIVPVGAANARAEIRGRVTQDPGPVGHGSADPGPINRSCTATLEVFDNVTGRTSFVLQDPGPMSRTSFVLADPGPIARFGMVGATTGQTARLNIVAFPPNPCMGTLSFFGSNGGLLKGPMHVSLAPGDATFLDLDVTQIVPVGAASNPRAEIRGHVTQDPGPISVDPGPVGRSCTATLEVFDNVTGRTSFVLADPGPLQ